MNATRWLFIRALNLLLAECALSIQKPIDRPMQEVNTANFLDLLRAQSHNAAKTVLFLDWARTTPDASFVSATYRKRNEDCYHALGAAVRGGYACKELIIDKDGPLLIKEGKV